MANHISIDRNCAMLFGNEYVSGWGGQPSQLINDLSDQFDNRWNHFHGGVLLSHQLLIIYYQSAVRSQLADLRHQNVYGSKFEPLKVGCWTKKWTESAVLGRKFWPIPRETNFAGPPESYTGWPWSTAQGDPPADFARPKLRRSWSPSSSNKSKSHNNHQ